LEASQVLLVVQMSAVAASAMMHSSMVRVRLQQLQQEQDHMTAAAVAGKVTWQPAGLAAPRAMGASAAAARSGSAANGRACGGQKMAVKTCTQAVRWMLGMMPSLAAQSMAVTAWVAHSLRMAVGLASVPNIQARAWTTAAAVTQAQEEVAATQAPQAMGQTVKQIMQVMQMTGLMMAEQGTSAAAGLLSSSRAAAAAAAAAAATEAVS
jgi:hypothetical protein